jgi:hypothetical protein
MGPDYSPLSATSDLTSGNTKPSSGNSGSSHRSHERSKPLKEWSYFFRMMDDVCLLNAPTLSRWISQPHTRPRG